MIERHSWLRFCIIGGLATVIHYCVYYCLLLTGLVYSFAYGAGYGVSLCFNFWATGQFTFRTRLSARKGALFLASHGVNFLLHMSLLEFYVRVLDIPDKIAPLPVYLVAVPVNFVLVRFAMKDRKNANDE